MRIPSGVIDQVVFFVALDSTDLKTRETGLTTFTVYRSRNGGTATAMTTPTVAELSAGNMPGVYSLLLDEDMTIDAGDDSQEMVFHITQASMAPVTRAIELYRPKLTAGETLTVASGVARANDASGNAVAPASATTALNARLSTLVTLTGTVLTDGGNSATSFKTNLTAPATDHFKDAFLKITSGALANQLREITGSTGTVDVVLTVDALTATPADGVTFEIVND